jgi:hypothetical protein
MLSGTWEPNQGWANQVSNILQWIWINLNHTLGHAMFKFSSTSAIIPYMNLHESTWYITWSYEWNRHGGAILSLWIASSDVELDHDLIPAVKSGEISWDHLIITSCPRDPPRVAQILAALLSDHWFHWNDWSPDLSLSWLQSPSESKFLLIPSQHVQPTSFWIFLKLDPMHNHSLSEYDAATKLIPAKTCSR